MVARRLSSNLSCQRIQAVQTVCSEPAHTLPFPHDLELLTGCRAAGLRLGLNDFELYAIWTFEEADASTVAGDHFL